MKKLTLTILLVAGGGSMGTEARQENREVGETARGDFRGNPGCPFLDS